MKTDTKRNMWIKISGYATAGGDPVYECGNCHVANHAYGVEHPKKKLYCEVCGSRNIYPWENPEEV